MYGRYFNSRLGGRGGPELATGDLGFDDLPIIKR
jgi:hypothetical protein